jgi:hypothetical protein
MLLHRTNDAQMRWLKAEVLGALMTRHINEERQEAIAAAAAAVAPALLLLPPGSYQKDKGNVITTRTTWHTITY